MTDKKYFSLRELSQELNIPKSTIIKYKDFFPEFFKMYGEGKRKKFDETAYEVLKLVRELREEQKRDWMEIRELLEQKYAGMVEKPKEEEPSGAVSKVFAEGVTARLDHLAHLFTALTGEVVRQGADTRKIQTKLAKQDKYFIALAKALADLRGRVNSLQKDVSKKDKGNNRRLELLAPYVEKIHTQLEPRLKKLQFANEQDAKRINAQFVSLRNAIEKLAAAQRAAPPAPPPVESMPSDELRRIMAKIDMLFDEGAFNQSKYLMLLRENEALKNKLRQTPGMYEPPAAGGGGEVLPQKQTRTGILGRKRKDASRTPSGSA